MHLLMNDWIMTGQYLDVKWEVDLSGGRDIVFNVQNVNSEVKDWYSYRTSEEPKTGCKPIYGYDGKDIKMLEEELKKIIEKKSDFKNLKFTEEENFKYALNNHIRATFCGSDENLRPVLDAEVEE